MPDALPDTTIDLQEVSTRNTHARSIITGFRSDFPSLSEFWQDLINALDDALVLAAEITRLSAELQNARLDRANLLAAMRATLAAYADGEPDPLWYLRDELAALSDAPGTLSDASWRSG